MLQLIREITILIEEYPNIAFKIQFRVDSNFITLDVHKENKWSSPEIKVNLIDRLTMMKNRWNIFSSSPSLPESYTFLNDLRQKILHIVGDSIKIVQSAQEININKAMKESSENQDNVMSHYRKTFVLTESQCSELHRFFSPYRVPAGLTRPEILACIKVCPDRRKQLELYPMEFQPPVHPSLIQDIDKPISRTEGLKNAFYEMMIDLAVENDQGIFFS